MTKSEAKHLLHEFSKNRCVLLSDHCEESLFDRNLTTDDLLYLMFWGDVVAIEPGKRAHEWKCNIKGLSIDGDDTTFIAVIHEKNDSVMCVTVF